jgi:hypothetical protein
MSRLAALLALVFLQAPGVAQSPQGRPAQADGIVRLLADLETALSSGNLPSVTALAPNGLPADQIAHLTSVIERGTIAEVSVRERLRRPEAGGYDVLAEVFVSYGRRGRVATWQITAVPGSESPDRFELAALSEVAAVENLLKLTLNRTRQFTLRDFAIDAPDLSLRMSSGSAFVAATPSGITALGLQGDGEVTFSPPDPAEQGQLRALNGSPALKVRVESAFVRMSPGEFRLRAGSDSLVETDVNARALQRAEEIFDLLSPRTFTLDLTGLSADRWSLEPSAGNIVVEFRTGRFGWLTYALSPSEAEDISLFDRGRGRNLSVYASADRLARRGRFYSDDDNAAYDVEHYTLDVRFDPERAFLTGRASIRLRTRNRFATSLTFKLAPPLTVASVSAPDLGPLMALRVSGQSNVLVSLPRPIDRDTVLTLDVAYSGRLEGQALDREAIAPQAGVSQGQDPFGPEVRVVPEARYLYSNRAAWYPQAPVSDYATARLRLSVPSEFQIVASGTVEHLALEKLDSDAPRGVARTIRTVEYVADRPLRYLALVISRFVPIGRANVDVPAVAPATPLPAARTLNPFDAAPPSAARVDPRAPNSVAIEVVSTPRMAGGNRQMPARLASILGFYAATIGEAPYPDFTLAAVDDFLPGGHSPAFFAVLHQAIPSTPYSWSADPVAFDHTYQHFFVAHELAHQWWGQAVGWKNYHEQWLSEGLSQYFALLYAAHDRGADTMRSLLSLMRNSALDLSRQGPVYLGYRLGHIQNDGRIFRGLVYNKSAFVLHMLRGLIGDEAFFSGLRQFYAGFRFRKAGTDDLRSAMEAASGLPLGRFFERWVFSAAVPRLRTSARRSADGGWAMRVEQLDDVVFDVPVTFTVQFVDGTSEDILVPVTTAVAEHRLPPGRSIRRIQVREELTLAEFRN